MSLERYRKRVSSTVQRSSVGGYYLTDKQDTNQSEEALLRVQTFLKQKKDCQLSFDEKPQRKTERIVYSKNVRLTSDENEFEPEHLLKIIRINKIRHKQYNPTMVNKEWTRHFKEVITKCNRSGRAFIDYNQEFSQRQ